MCFEKARPFVSWFLSANKIIPQVYGLFQFFSKNLFSHRKFIKKYPEISPEISPEIFSESFQEKNESKALILGL